ncbi:MAG: site-2 protease family protein [Ruminococcus sp.]|nr:site-2 protease family protein [Ruminococcus sp.]
MKLRVAKIDLVIGYEAIAAMTAVLLLDRSNRILCCFLAALLHELGHILVMKICGVRVRGLKLGLFDVLISADEPPTVRADVLITLGGPLANFFFAAVFCPFSLTLGLPHLALGIFNLLPVMSLDGGHLLYIYLSRKLAPRTCEIIMRAVTFAFFLLLSTAGICLLFKSGYNYSLLLISLYLIAVLFLKK